MNVPVRERISAFAQDLVRRHAQGIRWGQLFHATTAAFPDTPRNTVIGSLHLFRTNLPPDIANPSRGLYKVLGDIEPELPAAPIAPPIREADFYEAFATWLREELQEATDAAPLGGNGFGGKWGTPDVIAVFRAQVTDIFKFPPEVISAEIKTDTHQLIVAFGQACAYRLFSHRVYLAIPDAANQDDLERLDALAGTVGIGLVKFDAASPDNPNFRVLTRAPKHEPDYFYVNKIMPNCVQVLRLGAW